MEISIPHQLIEAAASLMLGVAAGFLYDFLRVIRRHISLRFVTFISDALFWLICGSAVFLLGMSLGGGDVRIFMITLGILGAVLYFLTLSRYVIALCEKITNFLKFILNCILTPLIFAKNLVKKLVKSAKKVFQYYKKWYRINYHKSDIVHRLKKPSDKRKELSPTEAEEGRYTYKDNYSGSADICDRVTRGTSH